MQQNNNNEPVSDELLVSVAKENANKLYELALLKNQQQQSPIIDTNNNIDDKQDQSTIVTVAEANTGNDNNGDIENLRSLVARALSTLKSMAQQNQ